MERWQFALPVQLARRLPPLVESAKRLDGEGDWRKDVAREKLKTAVSQRAGQRNQKRLVSRSINGELCWGGQPFRADRVVEWQKLQLAGGYGPGKKESKGSRSVHTCAPAEAVVRILGGLDAEPLE